MKLGMRYGYLELLRPAAFGRLCVETRMDRPSQTQHIQPPSGGCVLKLKMRLALVLKPAQPPSGGCVLKILDKLK